MKYKLIIIIILAISAKIILHFLIIKNLSMNPDEERNFQIALNNQNGIGYTVYDIEKNRFIQTAFHGSFTVFTYELLIKTGIKKEIYVLSVYILSMILFGLSIYYFHKLCLKFIDNIRFALLATVTYSFYPSILFYIGTLFFYENFALSLLVITIYKLLSAIKDGFKTLDYLVIPFAVTLSCLFRPQTIVIYFVISFVFCLVVIFKKKYSTIPLVILSFILAFTFHIPIFLKNKKMFGEYVLSTQFGFELLQGHNPTAKGSWMGNWKDSTNQLYQYSNTHIKNIKELNELEESKARKQLALKWIKDNPWEEIKLLVRKLAIYFLPRNYEVLNGSDKLNPINLLTHIFFICFILIQVFKRAITFNELLIFSPIVASILLSVVFFVGYRWRLYAEPFMIIFAWKFISLIKYKLDRKTMPSP